MADDKAMEYLRNYHGSIDSTALLLAYRAGRRGGLEEAAQAAEDFDAWVWCRCSECRADARSHAIAEGASMRTLATSIRALRDSLQPEGK